MKDINRNTLSKERIKFLNEIFESIMEKSVTVIVGIAEVGKTTLCRLFYSKMMEANLNVVWLDSSSCDIENKLKDEQDSFIIINGLDEFRCDTRTKIIEFAKSLVYTHIVINSRDFDYVMPFNYYRLNPLSLSESIELYQQYNNDSSEFLEKLFQKNNIPLTPLIIKELAKVSKAFDGNGKNYTSNAATAYNELGGVYQTKGEYERALQYYEKALSIRVKALGEDHPETAIAYNNLGGIYQNMGEYERALQYYEKALLIRVNALGEDHPETAIAYNNLGGIYQDIGEYKRALQYYEKALLIRVRVLGTEHPETATVNYNLASVYQKMGNYNKALHYYLKSCKTFISLLGSGHPSSEIVKENMKLAFMREHKNANFDKWLCENLA